MGDDNYVFVTNDKPVTDDLLTTEHARSKLNRPPPESPPRIFMAIHTVTEVADAECINKSELVLHPHRLANSNLTVAEWLVLGSNRFTHSLVFSVQQGLHFFSLPTLMS